MRCDRLIHANSRSLLHCSIHNVLLCTMRTSRAYIHVMITRLIFTTSEAVSYKLFGVVSLYVCNTITFERLWHCWLGHLTRTVPDITYNVFGGTLDIAQSSNKVHFWCAGASWGDTRQGHIWRSSGQKSRSDEQKNPLLFITTHEWGVVIFLVCRYILKIARSSLTMKVKYRVKINLAGYYYTRIFSITMAYPNK